MELLYIYCSSCGYEDFDQYAVFSRTTAGNGNKGKAWYHCPNCKCETSNVDTGEEEEIEVPKVTITQVTYSEVDMISNLFMSRALASRLVALGITYDKLKGDSL
jgi:hypothetical protein